MCWCTGRAQTQLEREDSLADMKLVDFRIDARKKRLRDKEVFDYIAMVWRLVPREGAPKAGTVSANFHLIWSGLRRACQAWSSMSASMCAILKKILCRPFDSITWKKRVAV